MRREKRRADMRNPLAVQHNRTERRHLSIFVFFSSLFSFTCVERERERDTEKKKEKRNTRRRREQTSRSLNKQHIFRRRVTSRATSSTKNISCVSIFLHPHFPLHYACITFHHLVITNIFCLSLCLFFSYF
jgi:hypothetical protein